MIQQARTQLESQPQRLAPRDDLPSIGVPAVGDGGQFSAGTVIGNKAVDVASKVAYGMTHQIATLPQRAIDAAHDSFDHTYGHGPSMLSERDAWVDPLPAAVAETAMMVGGVGAGRAGAIPAATSASRVGSEPLASRSALIYNPPAKSPRPFEADYPAGAPTDAAGNLSRDIDGRNLTARNVVGRRTLGGADEALTPAQLDAAGKAILGKVPESVPASALPRNSVGAYGNTRGPDGPERRIAVLKTLNPAARDKVAAHEFGHAIDDLAGDIDVGPLMDELRRVYNTLNNSNRATTPGTGRHGPQTGEAVRGRFYTPEDDGYRGKDVSREYVAEALRAYMADPNYLKTVAPKTAATIRRFVNNNPRLNKVIQFNSVVAPVGAGVLNADFDDDR